VSECQKLVFPSPNFLETPEHQKLTIFDAAAATPVVATLDPLPLVRDGVLLPLRLGRQVAAPAAGVATAAFTTRPPAASCAAEITVGERAACCRRLGRGERDVGARRLVARLQVDERRRAVVPCHGLVAAGVRMGMSVAHGWLVGCPVANHVEGKRGRVFWWGAC